MTSVFIVGHNEHSTQYSTMFEKQGWDIASNIRHADLVQFTGGEDVIPSLYGQGGHPKTQFNRLRDIQEAAIFSACKKHEIPMAGICRGAQLINVLCGGSLWQHVNNHIKYTGHSVYDDVEGFSFNAPSLHHQMMKPAHDAFILGQSKESTLREGALRDGTITRWKQDRPFDNDVEVCVYFHPLALCFQPHPEKPHGQDAAEIYFYYLREYLDVKKD